MPERDYLSRITEIISTIRATQKESIDKAAEAFARSIVGGGRVYLFGSRHSVIPALESRKRGVTVVSVSSHQNLRQARASHSSGKKLAEVSDIAIDNCVPAEDALVSADGVPEKFAAGSTVAAASIAMALVAEVGLR